MAWYHDQTLLEALKIKIEASDWAEWRAASTHRKLKLSPEMKDRARIGALVIEAIEGTNGLNCWMQPVEGYKKLLAPESSVRLLDAQGNILYEGKWKESQPGHVQTADFFIWLAPKTRRNETKPSLGQKIKGLFRYLRNAKRR